MHGIPTLYQGVRFRSRLEATWAAFFDLIEWRWQYEPFDLPGWIPDFQISTNSKSFNPNYLVEVKPVPPDDLRSERPEHRKIEAAIGDLNYQVLLVGTSPQPCDDKRHKGVFVGQLRPSPTLFIEGTKIIWSAGLFNVDLHKWAQAKNKVQWKAPQ